jgi:hypothetical protein
MISVATPYVGSIKYQVKVSYQAVLEDIPMLIA